MIDPIAGFPAGVQAALSQRGEGPMGFNLAAMWATIPLPFGKTVWPSRRPLVLPRVASSGAWTSRVALTGDAPDDQLECDAVWTQQLGLACTIMTADCIPVLVSHERLALGGAAHAGWRGWPPA